MPGSLSPPAATPTGLPGWAWLVLAVVAAGFFLAAVLVGERLTEYGHGRPLSMVRDDEVNSATRHAERLRERGRLGR